MRLKEKLVEHDLDPRAAQLLAERADTPAVRVVFMSVTEKDCRHAGKPLASGSVPGKPAESGRDEFRARTHSHYGMFATSATSCALARATVIGHGWVEYARDRACVQWEQQFLRVLKHCTVIGRNLESCYEQEPVCCQSPCASPPRCPPRRGALTLRADAVRLL